MSHNENNELSQPIGEFFEDDETDTPVRPCVPIPHDEHVDEHVHPDWEGVDTSFLDEALDRPELFRHRTRARREVA